MNSVPGTTQLSSLSQDIAAQNNLQKARVLRGKPEISTGNQGTARTIRVLGGQSESYEDSPSPARTARVLRGQLESCEDIPSPAKKTLHHEYHHPWSSSYTTELYCPYMRSFGYDTNTYNTLNQSICQIGVLCRNSVTQSPSEILLQIVEIVQKLYAI